MKKLILILAGLLLMVSTAFGSNEIQFLYDDGSNLYALVRNPANAQIWDVGDTQFEAVGTWNDARAGQCDIALTGYDGELYLVNFPAAGAGRYLVSIYLRSGANPDTEDILLGSGEIVWNGSAEEQIIDTSGRTDVGSIEGTDATNQINAEADTALSDYDPPTNAEMEARTLAAASYFDPSSDTVDVGLIEGADATNQINAEADTALSDYDPPTKAELDSGFAALNDPTAAAVADAVWDEDVVAAHDTADTAGLIISELTKRTITFNTAIADDSALGQIADNGTAAFDRTTDSLQSIRDNQAGADAAAIADAVWDEAIADHTTGSTFGGKNQKVVPSETIGDYKADVSAVALEANVEGYVTSALGTYDPPTKAELDSGLAALNDPTAAAIADAVWDEAIADHTTGTTFGGKNQKVVPSETIGDYKADVSAVALEANVETHVTNSLNSYDPPTNAEMEARTLAAASYFDPSSDTVDVGLIEGVDATNQINAAADTALSDYDPPTKAELDSGLAALNDPTVAAIADAVWDEDVVAAHDTADTAGLIISELTKRTITFNTAIADDSALGQIVDNGTAAFDRTTDSLQAIADSGGGGPTAGQIADAVWDEAIADHTTGTTFGGKNQKVVPSETAGDYKADVSAVAIEANVETHVTNSLNSYDPPTKTELDSGLAGLNDPTAATIADAVWDEAIADHTTGTTFGGKNQKVVPSETAGDYKADVSAVAIEANVETHVTNSLNSYDPPTKAELDSGLAALNDPTAAAVADAVWDEDVVAAHGTADTAGLIISEMTKRTITFNTAIADDSALGQIADNGTAAFDRTTDSLQAIADSGGGGPTAAQIADAVWDEAIVDHTTSSTFGGKNQKVVPSETTGDYKADVSAVAIEANVETHVTNSLNSYDPPTNAEMEARTLAAASYFDPSSDTVDVGLIEGADATNQINAEADTALSDYDPPTKAELDSGLAALNDPTVAAIVAALMGDTGITAGGTYTFEDYLKAMGAYNLGTWRDKSGEGGTIQELLDWEDDSTVILELTGSATTPYKTTTKQ